MPLWTDGSAAIAGATSATYFGPSMGGAQERKPRPSLEGQRGGRTDLPSRKGLQRAGQTPF